MQCFVFLLLFVARLRKWWQAWSQVIFFVRMCVYVYLWMSEGGTKNPQNKHSAYNRIQQAPTLDVFALLSHALFYQIPSSFILFILLRCHRHFLPSVSHPFRSFFFSFTSYLHVNHASSPLPCWVLPSSKFSSTLPPPSSVLLLPTKKNNNIRRSPSLRHATLFFLLTHNNNVPYSSFGHDVSSSLFLISLCFKVPQSTATASIHIFHLNRETGKKNRATPLFAFFI